MARLLPSRRYPAISAIRACKCGARAADCQSRIWTVSASITPASRYPGARGRRQRHGTRSGSVKTASLDDFCSRGFGRPAMQRCHEPSRCIQPGLFDARMTLRQTAVETAVGEIRVKNQRQDRRSTFVLLSNSGMAPRVTPYRHGGTVWSDNGQGAQFIWDDTVKIFVGPCEPK
jgi:hypothetical protein